MCVYVCLLPLMKLFNAKDSLIIMVFNYLMIKKCTLNNFKQVKTPLIQKDLCDTLGQSKPGSNSY